MMRLQITTLKMTIVCLLVMMFVFPSYSTDCKDTQLQPHFILLQKLIDEYKPGSAISLADSLLFEIRINNLENCKIKYAFILLKGEGLEFTLKYDEALEMYYSILPEVESLGYWNLMVETYISIGRVYEVIGRPLECKKYLNQALHLIRSKKLESNYSHFAVRYSSYHRIYGNKDTALIYANEAIIFGQKYSVKRSQIDGTLLLGILSDNVDNSISYFKQAVSLYVENKSYYGAASQTLNIANRFIGLKKYKEALILIDTAMQHINQITDQGKGYYFLKYRLNDLKRQIFIIQNQIDSAYQASELKHKYWLKSNSLIEQDNINLLEYRFSVEKEKAKYLYYQNETNIFRIALIIVVLFTALLIYLLINISNKRQMLARQNNLIVSKNESLQLALEKNSTLLIEIHHRVKNNLQTIISLLEIYEIKETNPEIKDYIQDISTKVMSIALIHEHLYMKGDFGKINMNEYIIDLFQHWTHMLNPNQKFDFTCNTSDINLNIETAVPLGTICTELIGNSIKYAIVDNQILNITINISRQGNTYTLNYNDNGRGFIDGSLMVRENSIGTFLINSMTRQLNGELISRNNKGAEVVMLFKEKIISKI